MEQRIRKEVNKIISTHMNGLEEILNIEEAIEISREQNLNIIGLINALATKLMLMSEEEDFNINEEEVEKVTDFIESISESSSEHPIDVCFKLIKMLSDILVQLTVIETIAKENN